jgi:hypothetical protein
MRGNGVQGVGGSNPLVPTIFKQQESHSGQKRVAFFRLLLWSVFIKQKGGEYKC